MVWITPDTGANWPMIETSSDSEEETMMTGTGWDGTMIGTADNGGIHTMIGSEQTEDLTADQEPILVDGELYSHPVWSFDCHLFREICSWDGELECGLDDSYGR